MRTAPSFARIAMALGRPALWFCVANLLPAVLPAQPQCTNVTQVPDGTISSGNVCYWNNNTLTAAGVIINGSASVTFLGGNTVHLTPGFRATAGTAGTTFHPWVELAPSAVSFLPSSGSGLSQQFTFTGSSPSGYSSLWGMQALFNTSVSGVNACYISYNQTANLLFLADNSGNSWLGGFAPGSGGSATNSQCTIYGSGSSVSPAGNQLSVTVNVTFQTSFSGLKNEYLKVFDNDGMDSTWQTMGTWTVAGVSTIPQTITTTPTGLSLTVDGVPCIAPCNYQWVPGSSHSIATTLQQTPYFFSYWSDSGALTHTITASSSTPTYTANFASNALQALRNCLSSSGSATCTLASGTHTVDTAITVSRSGVTVTGASSARSCSAPPHQDVCWLPAILVRGTGNTEAMMLVDHASQAVTGVTIKDLTFCGNSALNNPTPNPACQSRVMAVCPLCEDLAIRNADANHATAGGAYTDDPFNTSGPYSVSVSNCVFEDAPGRAISLYPTAPHKANDIYISGSDINSSAVTGILSGANGPNYRDSRVCDTWPGDNFKNDTSVALPRNIKIEGNRFRNNNTGAIGMVARWVGLRNNTFTNNYMNPQAGEVAGGTVFFDQCTDKVEIYKNTLTGPSYNSTEGLELWGRNIAVGADDQTQRNTISGYLSDGITANSGSNQSFKNNTTSNNGGGPFGHHAGIVVWTAGPGLACDPVPRNSKSVTVSGNTSEQTYGLFLGDRPGLNTTNTIDAIAVNASGTIRLDPYVTLHGWSGDPPPTPVEPESAQLVPRALAVNPISPAWPKCTDTSSPTEVFTFGATDVDVAAGAGNIYWLQGMFSIAGNDETGSGGPDNGAQGCHFLFYPPENTASCTPTTGCGSLFLDGDDGGFNWVSASPSSVGPGGIELANSYCKIRAGAPSSAVTFDGKVMKLTIEIEFLSSSKKHMYTATANRQGLTNNGDGVSYSPWRYSGWWKRTP